MRKIGAVIGTGGKQLKELPIKVVQRLISTTMEQSLLLVETNKQLKSLELVKSIVEEPEVGKIYQGTVKRIMDFGAFIEIPPGKEDFVILANPTKQGQCK